MFGNKRSVEFPTDSCPICNKKYVNYRTLKMHITTKHAEMCLVEGESETSDITLNYSHQLLKVLLIKRCLDYAIQSGNGKHVSLLMKHMILYYRQLGYTNYALACFEHVAQCQLFLSDRLRELIIYDCFVNNTGKKLQNKAMDLDLEHRNKFFKENFTLKSSDPSEEVLNRLSLSQDMVELILNNFYSEFGVQSYSAHRCINEQLYKKDVVKLFDFIHSRNILERQPTRLPLSSKLKEASHDPLLLIDVYDLKQWFQNSLRRMATQRFLK